MTKAGECKFRDFGCLARGWAHFLCCVHWRAGGPTKSRVVEGEKPVTHTPGPRNLAIRPPGQLVGLRMIHELMHDLALSRRQ